MIVTGKTLGLVTVSTASPVAPGYSRLEGDGEATAAIVRFDAAAACPSAEEPALSPVTQLVAAYAAAPTSAEPTSAARTLDLRVRAIARRRLGRRAVESGFPRRTR